MRTPWQEARRIAREAAKPLGTVLATPSDAADAALAAPLRARDAQPVCDVSAMDGYAVAGEGPWRVTGTVLAGSPPLHRLHDGAAVVIATGAPVPAGADAVLPVEHAELHEGWVRGQCGHKSHIRRRGEDFEAGEVLLPEGTLVTAPVSGLIAATGQDTVEIYRKPRVKVVVTGDEVLPTGRPDAGRVRDAIGPMLPTLIDAQHGVHAGTEYLPDRLAEFERVLRDRQADVIAVCGATSAGKADHLRAALQTGDADVLVQGVACRPGHPQLLAAMPDGRFVIGLPGNPFAALAAALTMLCPLLGALGGYREAISVIAEVAQPITPHARDTRLVPCRRVGGALLPITGGGSASLVAPALADVLAVVPPGRQAHEVEVLALCSLTPS